MCADAAGKEYDFGKCLLEKEPRATELNLLPTKQLSLLSTNNLILKLTKIWQARTSFQVQKQKVFFTKSVLFSVKIKVKTSILLSNY